MSIQDLTAAIALQKATAAEVVSKEVQAMRETTTGSATSGEVYKLFSKTKCYHCGKSGHHPTNCKYKSAKCYSCQKVGHLAAVCQSKKHATRVEKSSKATENSTKAQRIRTLQETQGASSDSSESEHSYTVLQLGTKLNKFLITVHINRVPVEMEVDSGAKRSTVPL